MAIVFHLNDVLNKFDIRPLAGNIPDLWFDDVTDDSRKCGPGILFVAIEGYRADGHDYLEQAARLDQACFVRLAALPPALVVDLSHAGGRLTKRLPVAFVVLELPGRRPCLCPQVGCGPETNVG